MASNLLNLERTLHQLRDACSGFHLDVMDSQFVPNLAFSLDTVNAIRHETPLIVWTHLMVLKPEKYVKKLALKENDIVSLHYESASLDELKTTFHELQARKVKASCALQPDTPISVLHNLIGSIDHVLIMSVPAGFAGQPFLPGTVGKLQELAQFQQEYATAFEVGVDGGINLATIQEVVPLAVHDIALGSSLFFGNKPEEKLEQFAKII